MGRYYGYQVKDIDQISDWVYHSCSTWHTCEVRDWYQQRVEKSGYHILDAEN